MSANLTPEIYTGSNIIDNFDDAVAALARLLPATDPPDISASITDLLNAAKRCTVWQPNTVYNIGDEVIPTQSHRNGRRYRAIPINTNVTAFTSGATEPPWLIRYYPSWRGLMGQAGTVGDGNGRWQEWGPEVDLWDIYQAASQGWQMKANLAAPCFDVSLKSNSFKSSQVYDHFMKQAERYASRGFG